MAKPPSSTVLLLDLEDLKKRMMSVQAEVGRCLATLMAQSKNVCKVLVRLEIVIATVRAEQARDGNGRVEEEKSLPEPALERYVHTDHEPCFAAESMESFGDFREIAKSDMDNRNEGCISSGNQSYKPEILKNKVKTVKELAAGFNEADDSSQVTSAAAVKENDETSDKIGNDIACLDSMPPSTRPRLPRRCRKNVKVMEDLEYCNDEATTVTSAPSTSATLATKSGSFQYSKVSSPSSLSTGQTSSSMKMSTTSIVNIVKKGCREKGWKVIGSYSSRKGKEGCGIVHFYKLEVKGGVTDLMTRGVGESKVEAVRRAFKSMMDKMSGVDSEVWERVDSDQLKNEDGMCDNIVDFPDEEPMMEVESKSSSEHSLSPPPLFHSKDCVAPETLGAKGAKYQTETVKKRLVSSYDASLIIGNQGTNINRISKETGVTVDITVRGDLVKGRQDRLVELLGEKASVDKAVEMINKTLKVKENLATLTVTDYEAGHIIGKQGTNINRITKETGVKITVGGLVKGRQDRLVEVWGQKTSVGEALKMIKEIIQK